MNDSIILRGCNRVTRWLVPETLKKCPMNRCREVFKTRRAFITHFKELHAMHAIFCELCVEPIPAKYTIAFNKHYESKHPGVKVPFGFKKSPNQINNRKRQANHVCFCTLLIPVYRILQYFLNGAFMLFSLG